MDLFKDPEQPSKSQPLADRLRPRKLEDIVGQDHLLGPSGSLFEALAHKSLGSMILWGPPGCGKTTIARLLADHTDLAYEPISAIFSGITELRKIFEAANVRRNQGRGTLLFVDEIHRFNKAQQDAFLPYLEDGTVVLVGATTENPSFELNSALLSRCSVHVLRRLGQDDLELLLQRAEHYMGQTLPLTLQARDSLKLMADGDGRHVLMLAERLFPQAQQMDAPALASFLARRAPLYDKGDDAHYNLISALHKSVRGSDPDAALYWFSRMIEGGEDPHYIARRMVRMAIEDIGLADPQAQVIALNGWQIFERLGAPEGHLALANVLIYLATSPKSNSIYTGLSDAMAFARNNGSLMPPKHILNAPTQMMKQQGFGKNYAYDHNNPEGFSGQNYFPNEIERVKFYDPKPRGYEREVIKRIAYWDRLRDKKALPDDDEI